MIKRIIASLVSLLFIINSVYFTAFAEETIRYSDPETIIYQQDFESGVVGQNVADFDHTAYNHSGTVTESKYQTLTFAENIGTNTSKVGNLYDGGHSLTVNRVTDTGEPDISAVKDSNKNVESHFLPDVILEEANHLNLKFKYYVAENAVDASGNAKEVLKVSFTKSGKRHSSTSPAFEINPTSIKLIGKENNAETSQIISNIPRKSWIDVEYDVVLSDDKKVATCTLKANGSTKRTVYDNVDGLYYLTFCIDCWYGGKVYLDDILLKNIDVYPDSLKDAAAALSFDDVCDGTFNTQNAIIESWKTGLPSSTTSGGDTYSIEWISSAPEVINSDGFVSPKRQDTMVTLTARIKKSKYVYAEKDFLVKVIASEVIGDVVTHSNPSATYVDEDFEDGTIGENVPLFAHTAYSHSGVPTGEQYQTITYAGGVGSNMTGVGTLYERGHAMGDANRVTDTGEPDTNAVRPEGGNKDVEGFFIPTVIIKDSTHLNLKFKYYSAENSPNSQGFGRDVMTVSLIGPGKKLSSTAPSIVIKANSITLNGKENNVGTTQMISNIPRKSWVDVEYDVVFSVGEDNKTIADCTLKANGMTVQTKYDSCEALNYLYFGIENWYGGRFYLDDIKLVDTQDYPDSLKAAANNMDFSFVSQGTNNSQGDVHENWSNGFPSSVTYGEDTYPIEWTSSDESVITSDGIITPKSYKQSAFLTAKIIKTDRVYSERVYEVIISALSGQTPEGILADYANDKITEAAFSEEVTDTSNDIKQNILPLPTRDDVANIDIFWTASPEGIIDIETGVVTRPDYMGEDTEVTLTASLSMDGGTPYTKSIKYNVIKLPDPQDVLQEAIDDLVLTDEESGKITKNLNLPTSYGDVLITWDTSGHSQIDENGTVTRGDREVTGTITAHLSLRGFTADKTYEFTVYPTLQKMMEIDIESIDKTGWDAIKTNFTVPLVGEKYLSELTWGSPNSSIAVAANGKMEVRRPSFNNGNASFSLLVHAENGGEELDMSIPVTVVCMEDDAVIAANAAALINFDLIRDQSDTQDAVTKNLALPTSFEFDSGIEVIWSSSDEDVVKPDGTVIRPMPGSEPAQVTLTAVVKKNYSTAAPVYIDFYVKPFDDINELLNEAKESLVFSVLSNEEIDAVTKNLYLPTAWKYNTTIEWICNSEFVEISGNEGVITRPEWGQTEGAIILTADISYGDNIVSKHFSITILENENLEETDAVMDEDFNEWTDDYNFNMTASNGLWTVPESSTGSSAYPYDDPLNSGNTVLCTTMDDDQKPVGSVSYSLNSSEEGTAIIAGMKLYVDNTFTGIASFEILSTTHSQIAGRINNSVLELDANIDSAIKSLKLEAATINKGDWNDIYFEIDTTSKKFNVYLNGECVTDNGEVIVSETSEAFDTSAGIPFIYYNDSTRPADVKGFKWSTNQGSLFIDDAYITKKLIYTEKQKNASIEWKKAFTASNDINSVKTNLVLPRLTFPGIFIDYESSNPAIVSVLGEVSGVESPTSVIWTVSFSDGNTSYREKYILNITKIGSNAESDLTDAEAVKADLKDAVDYITSTYNLTDLKFNIDLSKIVSKNGSKISYKSSDTSYLSDSGVVSLKDNTKDLTFTITAEKGIAKKSEVLQVTVGKKSSTDNGGGGGGGVVGGGGGSKPVYGPNTVAQSGIDINAPIDGENNNESLGFADVDTNHWAYDEILYLVDNKIMNGVGDGRIEPDRTISREEFIKMLVCVLGCNLSEGSGFTDVDESAWYAPYIAAAKENGLINGYEDGSVGIGENISRQDMSIMIYRATNLVPDISEKFADDETISDYSKDAVYALRSVGIINGKENNLFDPTASATRAETASMLYKAIKIKVFE